MQRTKALLGAWTAALLILALHPAAQALSERAVKLEQAASSPGTVRSVYFVEGMACRACTLIMDRYLAREEGVYWARFNYPLRIFTVYHDPAVASVAKLEEFVGGNEELEASLLESRPAAGFLTGDAVAAWKGGGLSLEEALALPPLFRQGLSDYMLEEGTDEWYQVVYEIAGEEARNRLLQRLARGKGYDGAEKTALPFVVSKDFYWPSDRIQPTAAEAAMARFVNGEILQGEQDQKESIRKFDAWLRKLYQETDFDFRGEIMELQEMKK